MIRMKRIYEPPADDDGFRVLVDRVWPRGVSKAEARLDAWLKDLAPSTDLRKWYGHAPERWPEFQSRYREELKSRRDLLAQLRQRSREGTVTLLYAARDGDISNAAVLLSMLKAG